MFGAGLAIIFPSEWICALVFN